MKNKSTLKAPKKTFQKAISHKIFFSILITIFGFMSVGLSFYLFCPKPELKGFQTYSRAYTDRNDRLLRITLAQDDQYRLYAPLEAISPVFQEATLLYEDQDFYQHGGIDVTALCRAFWDTYIGRKRKIGASTIAMQVARLRWDIRSQTLWGKAVQILRAVQLTRHYTKSEILEAYFNLASYGRNIEGVEAASLIYFNKYADALSLPEALTLCVIPQNPSKRNPTTRNGFAALQMARDIVFKRWIQHHKEDKNKQVFMELPLAVRCPEELPFLAPHFIEDLERTLAWHKTGIIKTALNLDMQTAMEQMVSNYIERRHSEGIKNAVAMLVNYQTMTVEAVVGSADYFDKKIHGQVNGATSKRSPGSALKPFVYALAMDQGVIHPMTLLKDAPKRYAGFTPENFDQRFMGPVFAKDALINSRNVPAVYLQAQLSEPSFYEFLKQTEISGLKSEGFYGLALALGGAEVTMEELVALYAMLPNGGILHPLKKVINETQHPIYPFRHSRPAQKSVINSGRNPDPQKLLSPEACFLILDILKNNSPPKESRHLGQINAGSDIAWKTGTSFAFRDAWAVGISGHYVLAVWVGNFPGDGNPNFIGRLAAGPLLFEIFNILNRDKQWKVEDAISPEALNLKKVAVCARSGDLPSKYSPNTIQSWFIPGVSPLKVSTVHRAIPIDMETGLRSCWCDPNTSELQVYEFWPSDILRIYHLAGISLKTPPPFKSSCSLDDLSASGTAPVIQSPRSNVIYALQSHKLKEEKIPFSAIVDADVETLYWFVDNQFVGRIKKGKTLFWKPTNGTFIVQVVDDHGRSSDNIITVKITS